MRAEHAVNIRFREEALAYWLLKSEPGSCSWADLVSDGGTEWDGVRNAAAAGYLRAMAIGDEALFYHSGAEKAAVGIVRIARTVQPDTTDKDASGRWVSVRIDPAAPLPRPVALAAMRAEPPLAGLAMLRQPRLSVSPVTTEEWRALAAMSA